MFSALYTDVDHHIARFLDSAKELEAFFSDLREKEMKKPDVSLRNELSMLEKEIADKDACLEKYLEKVKQWEASFRELVEDQNSFEERQLLGTPVFLPAGDLAPLEPLTGL